MAVSINDSVALVTGGARGIGAAIAGCLADAGAKVMIADIGVDAQDSGDWRYALADEADLDEALA